MVWLTLMLFCACKVKRLADQLTVSSTLMLPLVPPAPPVLAMVTLPEPSSLLKVAPSTSPPEGAMLKSVGSMVQVPFLPFAASEVTTLPSATFTRAALVSIMPPLPPLGALASSVPPTCTTPLLMSDSSRICPPWFCSVRAWITPLLLTTAWVSASAALAVKTTVPPSALMPPALATKALAVPASTL